MDATLLTILVVVVVLLTYYFTKPEDDSDQIPTKPKKFGDGMLNNSDTSFWRPDADDDNS